MEPMLSLFLSFSLSFIHSLSFFHSLSLEAKRDRGKMILKQQRNIQYLLIHTANVETVRRVTSNYSNVSHHSKAVTRVHVLYSNYCWSYLTIFLMKVSDVIERMTTTESSQ